MDFKFRFEEIQFSAFGISCWRGQRHRQPLWNGPFSTLLLTNKSRKGSFTFTVHYCAECISVLSTLLNNNKISKLENARAVACSLIPPCKRTIFNLHRKYFVCRCREEIEEVIGGRRVSMSDLFSLPYLQATIAEVFLELISCCWIWIFSLPYLHATIAEIFYNFFYS